MFVVNESSDFFQNNNQVKIQKVGGNGSSWEEVCVSGEYKLPFFNLLNINLCVYYNSEDTKDKLNGMLNDMLAIKREVERKKIEN